MAQHTLRSESGSVAIEFLLTIPLLMFVSLFVVQVEKAMRQAWIAQEGARVAVFAWERGNQPPDIVRIREYLARGDKRLVDVLVSEAHADGVPSGSEGGSADNALAEFTSTSAGASAVTGAAVRASFEAQWMNVTREMFVDLHTGSALEMGLHSESFEERGSGETAGAMQDLMDIGRRVGGQP